jgi:hypothetical protein
MDNNSKNLNLHTGEEDNLAAIQNERTVFTEKRRILSSFNPSNHFNSGSKAVKDTGPGYGLGFSKSFSDIFSGGGGVQVQTPTTSRSASSEVNNEETRARFMRGYSGPPPSPSLYSKNKYLLPSVAEKGIFSTMLGGRTAKSSFKNGRSINLPEEEDQVDLLLRRVDHTSGPLRLHRSRAGSGEEEEGNEDDGEGNKSSNDMHSLDNFVIDLKHEDSHIDDGKDIESMMLDFYDSLGHFVIDLKNEDGHFDNASAYSLGSNSYIGGDRMEEEEEIEFLYALDDACDRSGDGSGVASFEAGSIGIYSRFSGIFKGKRATQTAPISSDSRSTALISDLTHPDDDPRG